MAERKSKKVSADPEQAAVDKPVGEPGVQSPMEGTLGNSEWKPVENILPEPEEMPPDPAGQDETRASAAENVAPETGFRIICRNKVTEIIGGVKFVDGVGYTKDGFSASWFANKNGYEVSRADPGK